jgi:hypothetical protein
VPGFNNKRSVYSRKYNKKILTVYDEPYFGLEPEDRCRTLSVSVPWSLDDAIQRRANYLGLKKSRYIRLCIENDLKIYYDV